MCGIVCFYGQSGGVTHVLDALELLAYRAPDSSGIAVIGEDEHFALRRAVGTGEQLREKIDTADERLIAALAERMRIVDEIGRYKRDNNVSILQPDRWKEIVASRVQAGIRNNLSERFMLDLYRCIHAESIAHQEAQFGEDDE